MTRPPRLLIFDMDGTLIDSNGPNADLFCEMLQRECGVEEVISRPIYVRLLGRGPKSQFSAALLEAGTEDEALVQDLTRRYWLEAEKHPPLLFPEVKEVLADLRREGNMMVVSTGAIPASAGRTMQMTGIDRLFRLILGSEEGIPALSKGPGHFALIAEALEVSMARVREQSVFVGDGVYDMEVAREAGIVAVGRLTGDNAEVLRAAGADHLVRDLRELPPLLETIQIAMA